MQTGVKIKKDIIVVSAVVATLFREIFTACAEQFFQINVKDSFWEYLLFFIISYILVFIISYFLSELITKNRFLRRNLFNERIVEGKWFVEVSCEQNSTHNYGIAETCYNDDGELSYRISIYSQNFSKAYDIKTDCTSITYVGAQNVEMKCAWSDDDGKENGRGEISFTTNGTGCKRHNGKLSTTDSKLYSLDADLISNKRVLKELLGDNKTFKNALEQLIQDKCGVAAVSNRANMKATLEEPEFYERFCQFEDCERNIEKHLKKDHIFKDKSVLIVGARTGRFIDYIINDVVRMVCTENSERNVRFMRKKYINEDKITFCQCDISSIPVFINEKFDYIIAGYSLGASFNTVELSDAEKRSLYAYIMDIFKTRLNKRGTLIIVETLGIGAQGRYLDFDEGLVGLDGLIGEEGNFIRRPLDTSFKFNDHDTAYEVIGGFWGQQAVERIENTDNIWRLRENSVVYERTFN